MLHTAFRLLDAMGSEWVLVVLACLSVVTVWIWLLRGFELRRLNRVSQAFWTEHADAWFSQVDLESWRSQVAPLRANYVCLESEILDVLERARHNRPGSETRVLEAYLEQRKIKLEKYVGILGTIGANAPFIGLLGTVLGIIRAFSQLSTTGLTGGMESVTGGIAEALIATAIGLLVAVPAVIAFNLLSKRISLIIRRAQSLGLFVLGDEEGKKR